MEKITTKQLIDIAVDIVDLADRCHKAGLIKDWQATFSITDEDNYEFSARVDRYATTEKKWEGKSATYAFIEKEDVVEPNYEQAVALRDYLSELISKAIADIECKLKILEG